jgi:hypothetical protein
MAVTATIAAHCFPPGRERIAAGRRTLSRNGLALVRLNLERVMLVPGAAMD